MTTINTWLTYAIILNLVQYWYLYVMVNHPWEYHLDMSPHSSCMVLQLTRLNTKLFSYNSYLFLFHTLVWACVLYLKLQLLLVSFISQSLVNRFQHNLYYCSPYACTSSTAIFTLITSLKINYSREYFTQQSKAFQNSCLNHHFLIKF